MLLRSLTKHVKDQNWFAVFLDFTIVVFGILIAFQITNWNEGRSEIRQETKALVALKKELQDSIEITQARSRAYAQVTDAGKRSLSFLNGPKDCGDTCWHVIVDFMHASQWQDLNVSYSNYENMRTQGFPKNTKIVDAIETYRLQTQNNASTFINLPVYRSLVRQWVNIQAQEYYWANCWSIVDGFEEYVLDCPEGMTADQASGVVDEIVTNSNIKPHLTEWTGAVVSLPQTLGDQNVAAQKAIDLINEELERR